MTISPLQEVSFKQPKRPKLMPFQIQVLAATLVFNKDLYQVRERHWEDLADLAVLKMSAILLKYLTYDGFFMFSCAKQVQKCSFCKL